MDPTLAGITFYTSCYDSLGTYSTEPFRARILFYTSRSSQIRHASFVLFFVKTTKKNRFSCGVSHIAVDVKKESSGVGVDDDTSGKVGRLLLASLQLLMMLLLLL